MEKAILLSYILHIENSIISCWVLITFYKILLKIWKIFMYPNKTDLKISSISDFWVAMDVISDISIVIIYPMITY
jgi:hypothetical protein